jgi:hypothetical protein
VAIVANAVRRMGLLNVFSAIILSVWQTIPAFAFIFFAFSVFWFSVLCQIRVIGFA